MDIHEKWLVRLFLAWLLLSTLQALGIILCRVTLYALRLAEAVGLKRECIARLIKGSFPHDVGKIAIGDLLLLNPGKPTAAEREIMRTPVHSRHDNRIFRQPQEEPAGIAGSARGST